MGIVNAVLVTSKIAPRWVYSSASIATYGLLEDTISVGDLDDPALIDRIGAEFLASRAVPAETYVYQVADGAGQVAGVDYKEGDRLTSPALRVIDIGFSLLPDGRLEGTPGLASKLEEQARRNQDRVERLIAEGGGNTPSSSPPADTGSGVEAGKLEARPLTSWSWVEAADLAEEENWQPYPIDEPCRITELVIECDTVDQNGVQVANGDTRFRLLVNNVALLSTGALGSVPTDVAVAYNETSKAIPVFGGAILGKGDHVRFQVISSGNHVNGSLTIHSSEVV